jgi:SAM-dependent MidA family methyltransferase
MTGNPALIEDIRRDIAERGGRITFERFMELALYHPQHGYYTAARSESAPYQSTVGRAVPARHPRIGQHGDYFTSVSVGSLFGRILATQFRKWNATEVLEFGGHRGQLRDDILAAAPELRYRIVEIGDPLPDRIAGVVFSNEFLDALPVHRICGAQEVYVTENFAEELGPLSDPRLPRLPDGYRNEINLRALDWLDGVVRRLTKSAYIVTIDYGFECAEYFAPHHKDGHLQCYHRHTKNDNPYQHIGEQDITAHVEFTSLIERGEQLGLQTVLFTDQAHFLIEAGEAVIAEIVRSKAGTFSRERNAIHQLLHSTMGHAFKVLVQRKTATPVSMR